MRDWLDSIPNLGVPGVPGVQPQKSAIPDKKQGVPLGVPGVPAEHRRTGANPQKSATAHAEHLEHGISEQAARALLDEWHERLSGLDAYAVPQGIDRNRWGQLVLDCWWLYETHASRLVREGWTEAALFGLFVDRPGWGGLADRLQSARNVVFADDLAMWSRCGVKFKTCRRACEGLERSGLVLVWD